MASGFVIRKNQYYDSLFLMGINNRLSDYAGVLQTAVLMGTEVNKERLAQIGIQNPLIKNAQPNDLIVAVIAESQDNVDDVLGDLDQVFQKMGGEAPSKTWRSFEEGLAKKPNANLAVISIPGMYAAREARKALQAGLNVFLFSSNVPVEDEIELKQLAAKKNLLVMGPDCGTSLLNGVGIGFSNVVRRGNIGVIGASGTGLQEFTCLVHNGGSGISHAIGTGTNDVSDEVGGITTFSALAALEADPLTKVIALISKPPGKTLFTKLVARLEESRKPIVCCFLGAEKAPHSGGQVHFSKTIDDAVSRAIQLEREELILQGLTLTESEMEWAERERQKWTAGQRYLRGVFAGGTFCYQAQQILQNAGQVIYSNAPLDPRCFLGNPDQSLEHTLVDMGDEYYTLGVPHPMIDGTLRKQRILAESHDPQVAVLFLDFILGYNASMDPVGELLDEIIQTKKVFSERGAHLTVVASICGTHSDPQDLRLQMELLKEQGVYVFNSNARATLFCARMLAAR
jgi:succinyl-CoA synthetase alpha subunit